MFGCCGWRVHGVKEERRVGEQGVIGKVGDSV